MITCIIKIELDLSKTETHKLMTVSKDGRYETHTALHMKMTADSCINTVTCSRVLK